MATYIAGSGGGGKGGGGSARVAVEAPNTLKSKSYAKIVEVLCEGEIEGLVNGAQSIYLDSVPLQNSDGTFNYDDVVIETREGTLAQNVTKIGGTTESTISIGTEIKQAIPVLHTISNAEVDRARVSIRLPALTKQNTSNGDLNGSSVKLKIEYNPNGTGWVEPPVGSSTVKLDINSFTGVTKIEGSTKLTSQFTSEYYCTGQNGSNCRTVTKYLSSTVTLQYNKDNAGWVTFKTAAFKGKDQTVPFSFDVVKTSTYKIRVVLSSGSGSISFLNGYIPSGEVTISGKTTSPYERDYEFNLTGSSPWIIRVTRLTEDSQDASLQNKTFLSSVTSVFEEKFRYPATAYVALSIDAEQFSSIPNRAYDVKLLKIRVPTNYDPIDRVYTGIWDGTFKIAWSDNPAWCFYDLITNKRYGLGERIDESQVDKWSLYDIAQYCDELVDDGTGVLEPRFTCNVLIQTREEAYKVLQDIASIFAGTTYWGSGGDSFQGIVPVQDKPQETYAYAFNNSNVVDGVFSYQTANNNTQFNTVYVTYNDPLDEYKQKVVYVSDDQLIAQDAYINETSVVAFGCVSKAQAIRLGRRVLYTNKYENDVVSFSVGADGAIPSIGSVVQISDELRSGERRGGRVVEALSTTSVKVDSEFTLLNGVEYKLSVIDSSGVWKEVTLSNTPATTDILTFTPAISGGLSKNSPFILTDSGLESALYKVVSNTESDQHVYSISAVKHDPTKYGYIDDLTPLAPADESNSDLTAPVTNITATEVLYADGTTIRSKLVVSWTPAKFSSSYLFTWSNSLDNISKTVSLSNPTYEIIDTAPSFYNLKVTSYNLFGTPSIPVSSEVEVLGKLANPADVANLDVRAFSNSASLSWDQHPDLDVQVGGFIEIRFTPLTVGYTWENGTPISVVPGASTSAQAPLLKGTYMAKALDSSGKYSFNAAFADSNFAQIEELNVVVSAAEQPNWPGTKDGVYAEDGYITLTPTGSLDAVDFIDSVADWDTLNQTVVLAGTYDFENIIDLGGVLTSRVTSIVESTAINLSDTVDARADIDSWEDVDGDIVNDAVATLYISYTQDDPNLSPTWTPYQRFVIADYQARAFRFRIALSTEDSTHTVRVTRAEITIDMPDRVEGVENTSATSTGIQVIFNKPFYQTPAIAVHIDGLEQGDYYEVTLKTKSGFFIQFFDKNNIPVARQFDWIAKGFGIETVL